MNPRTTALAALAGTAALATAGFVRARIKTRAVDRRPAPGRFVEVDGVKLHVIQQGAGPDILLIHGAAMMATEMVLALGDALPGYRITAIDRPGHGFSDKRRRPSIHDQARLFHGAAAQLGLRSPTLVGHSLGGSVALAYADAFPGEISGLVTIAPLAYPGWGPAHLGRAVRGAPVIGPLLSNTTLAVTDPEMLRAILPLIFNPQKPPAAFREQIDIDRLARPFAMVADGADFTRASLDLQSLSKRYAELGASLHVVLGEKDRILRGKRQGERLARTVPGAQLTRIPGKGHMVHHFAPEAVRIAVADVRARSLAMAAPLARAA